MIDGQIMKAWNKPNGQMKKNPPKITYKLYNIYINYTNTYISGWWINCNNLRFN